MEWTQTCNKKDKSLKYFIKKLQQLAALIMDPRTISIHDYHYDLPAERIAAYPLEQRDQSKLLVYRQGKISEDKYQNIAEYLPSKSLLVFNNTRVVEARIFFQKATGGVIEIFCLEPDDSYPDITTAMMQHGSVKWKCLIGGASKWKHGQILQKTVTYNNTELTLEARYVSKNADSFIIQLSWTNEDLSFAEVLHHAGIMPLPPYIKRAAEKTDSERYQTVYADIEGSVAAPTAGLHFTENIFHSFSEKEIEKDFVTLHVGAGTFLPVKSETIGEHDMHSEFIDVSIDTIAHLRRKFSDGIFTIGTTSLRTVESLYWIGLQLHYGEEWSPENGLQQWFPYDNKHVPIEQPIALKALEDWMTEQKLSRLITRTRIIIAPGYEIKMAKGLITNFHQPHSTLLLLIAAFIGPEWKKIYQYALENDFRFLSYGDGCLLLR
jgi:S-adenosylmethionine:tRNA ribosyltransferase-isomerase